MSSVLSWRYFSLGKCSRNRNFRIRFGIKTLMFISTYNPSESLNIKHTITNVSWRLEIFALFIYSFLFIQL